MEPEEIRKNLQMQTVLKFVEEFAKAPKDDNGKRLTKSKICKKIGISDSSLKRTMKDLDIKSFYRHNVPVNKRKTKKNETKEIHPQKKKAKGGKKDDILSTKGGKQGLTDCITENELKELEKNFDQNYK